MSRASSGIVLFMTPSIAGMAAFDTIRDMARPAGIPAREFHRACSTIILFSCPRRHSYGLQLSVISDILRYGNVQGIVYKQISADEYHHQKYDEAYHRPAEAFYRIIVGADDLPVVYTYFLLHSDDVLL